MGHWSEYEPFEVTRWFDLECDDCLVVSPVLMTASVWRDGSIYGSWVCPDCGEDNSSEDIGNVADFVDVDVEEVN